MAVRTGENVALKVERRVCNEISYIGSMIDRGPRHDAWCMNG